MSAASDPVAGDAEPLRLDAATTRGEAVARLRRALLRAGIDMPALDARILATAALGIDAAALVVHPEEPLGQDGARRLRDLARRRLAREPVARILGERDFWGMRFALSPATLVPRPDTETVVELALDLLPARDAALSVLDLGTGSGCMLLALLRERPAARGVGIDRSPEAARMARANAAANGLSDRAVFAVSDWGAALGRRFDLVVANPPYVATPDLASLDREVTGHDPPAALDGGADGLEAYRAIVPDLGRLMAHDGLAVLEIGATQADGVAGLASANGLAARRLARDLGGRDRALALVREA